MYGHLWTKKFGDSPMDEVEEYTVQGETWAMALRTVSGRQIANAMEKLLVSGATFPPTLPEFKLLCFDIPTVEDCDAYLRGHAEPTPFTVTVARRMKHAGGSWKYRHASVEKAERMLRNAYEMVRADVMLGKPLDEVHMLIASEEPERKPASPETVAAARAKVAEVLNLNPDFTPVEPIDDSQENAHDHD